MKLRVMIAAFAVMVVVGVGTSQSKEPTHVLRVEQPLHVIDDTDNSSMEAVCGPDEEKRYSDLCAQWTAADAAKDAATSAANGNLISILAAVFSVIATGFTAVALVISIKSQKEIARSNAITHMAARAWVLMNKFEFAPHTKGDAGSGTHAHSAVFTIQNYGKTHAEKVIYKVACRKFIPDGCSDEFVWREWNLGPDVLAAGMMVDVLVRIDETANIESWLSSGNSYEIAIHITYKDVFVKTDIRETKVFRFMVGRDGNYAAAPNRGSDSAT